MEDPFARAYNAYIAQLSLEEIAAMSDAAISALAIEHPDHKGRFGFLLQRSYFRSTEHMAATTHALLMRLVKARSN